MRTARMYGCYAKDRFEGIGMDQGNAVTGKETIAVLENTQEE